MNKYAMLVYWSNSNDMFYAEVPELPGCMGKGSTYQAAVADAEVVMAEWVRIATALKRQIPQPKGALKVIV
jgi:predicted RNase H-like HicB family nuclease